MLSKNLLLFICHLLLIFLISYCQSSWCCKTSTVRAVKMNILHVVKMFFISLDWGSFEKLSKQRCKFLAQLKFIAELPCSSPPSDRHILLGHGSAPFLILNFWYYLLVSMPLTNADMLHFPFFFFFSKKNIFAFCET